MGGRPDASISHSSCCNAVVAGDAADVTDAAGTASGDAAGTASGDAAGTDSGNAADVTDAADATGDAADAGRAAVANAGAADVAHSSGPADKASVITQIRSRRFRSRRFRSRRIRFRRIRFRRIRFRWIRLRCLGWAEFPLPGRLLFIWNSVRYRGWQSGRSGRGRTDEQAGDLAVTVVGDLSGQLTGLALQRDVHHGVVAQQPGGRLPDVLAPADHGDRLGPDGGDAVGVQALAHGLVEVLAYLLPPALDEEGGQRDRPVRRAGQHGPDHRPAGSGVDRPPEPLEGGLPGRVQDISDLAPAMAGGPRPVHGRVQGRVRGGGQLPRRHHGTERRAGTRLGELIHEAACRVADPDGYGVGPIGHVPRCVKIPMTLTRCQDLLNVSPLAALGKRPPAPGRTPARGAAVPPPSTPSLLQR